MSVWIVIYMVGTMLGLQRTLKLFQWNKKCSTKLNLNKTACVIMCFLSFDKLLGKWSLFAQHDCSTFCYLIRYDLFTQKIDYNFIGFQPKSVQICALISSLCVLSFSLIVMVRNEKFDCQKITPLLIQPIGHQEFSTRVGW